MTLHSLNEFAKAKVVTKELEKVIKILNATEASLKAYEKYSRVNHILTTIWEDRAILQIQLDTYNITKETKGMKR